MTYVPPLTLWRGNVLLGEVVADLPIREPGAVYGLFRPAVAFTDIGHLRQTRMRIVPDAPVHVTRFTGKKSQTTNLRQMTEEEARGLPIDAQMVVRDGSGRDLDMDTIAIHPEEIPEGSDPWPDLCRQHGFVGRAWLLVASPPREEK
jgi:hypothetical protein